MSKIVSFAEHVSSQLEHVRAQREYVKLKVAELETALKLIHPKYSIVVGRYGANNLAGAALKVEFEGLDFAVDLDLVKHNDIHISDHTLELLIDRPVVQEDSPYFNATLERLIAFKLRLMTSTFALLQLDEDQVLQRRAIVVEALAKMAIDLKEAYLLLCDDNPGSLVDLVKNSPYELVLNQDPIGAIDNFIARRSKGATLDIQYPNYNGRTYSLSR